MSFEAFYICDGCGKKEEIGLDNVRNDHVPESWSIELGQDLCGDCKPKDNEE